MLDFDNEKAYTYFVTVSRDFLIISRSLFTKLNICGKTPTPYIPRDCDGFLRHTGWDFSLTVLRSGI
jgi:hypothetical protein